MSDGFSIKLKECRDAQLAIGGVAKDLVELKDELHRIAAPLVADWHGLAAQAYAEAQRRWNEDTDELNRILFAVNKALDESIAGYGGADQFGVNLFQQQG